MTLVRFAAALLAASCTVAAPCEWDGFRAGEWVFEGPIENGCELASLSPAENGCARQVNEWTVTGECSRAAEYACSGELTLTVSHEQEPDRALHVFEGEGRCQTRYVLVRAE